MDRKLENLLVNTLLDAMGTPTSADAETACANMRAGLTQLTRTLKKVNEPKGETGSMIGLNTLLDNWDEGNLPFTLKTDLQALLVQALWAVIFNKTMPQALIVYENMLKESVK